MGVDSADRNESLSYACGLLAAEGRIEPRNPFVEFPRHETAQAISRRFEQQVERGPERLAVKEGSRALTYEELNSRANAAAHAVLAADASQSSTVSLLLRGGISSAIGFLGALKAGGCCVPIDTTLPAARISMLLAHCRPFVVLADSESLSLAEELAEPGVPVISVDGAACGQRNDNPELAVSPDSPAYIVYTSGSTGDPKGVIQTHRSSLSSVRRSTNGRHICEDDRIALLARYGTGAWTNDFLGSLLNGATLVSYDVRGLGPTGIVTWLVEEQITVYHSVPTLFRHLGADLAGKEFPHLRLLQLSGEAVHASDVETYRKHFPSGCLFHNRFGCSEAGVVCQYFLDHGTTLVGNRVPVGYPADDVTLILVDESGSVVSPGQEGEIVVQSPNLSPGYWGESSAAQTAFGQARNGNERSYRTGDIGRLLADGSLIHLGRKDSQYKIRGHRVEARDVECAIAKIPGVREAVVDNRIDDSGEQRLVAYVVTERDLVWSADRAVSILRGTLPDYMVPTSFHLIDRIPETSGGKIDRRALSMIPWEAEPTERTEPAPRTPIEEYLATLWEEVLGRDQIGVRDDFFLLGGHSLLAGRVVARIGDELGIDLALSCLFESPTVEGLALRVLEKLVEAAENPNIDGLLEGNGDGRRRQANS